MLNWGAFCFGVVIGWVTYRTLRRSKTNGLSDIATIIGAVGGAAVTTLFPSSSELFGYYCVGLAAGFFAYLIVAGIVEATGSKKVGKWLSLSDEGF